VLAAKWSSEGLKAVRLAKGVSCERLRQCARVRVLRED